jgi:hypothetical protein
MACHLLGVLEPVVVLHVDGDACCPPGVTSDRGEKTRGFGPSSGSQPKRYSGSKYFPSPPYG